MLFIAATLTLGSLASTQTQMPGIPDVVLRSVAIDPAVGLRHPFEGLSRLQWIAPVLPLTHFIELVRGVVLRGANLGDLLLPICKLPGFAALSLAVVTLSFHESLD